MNNIRNSVEFITFKSIKKKQKNGDLQQLRIKYLIVASNSLIN